jgi:hypothetical protein
VRWLGPAGGDSYYTQSRDAGDNLRNLGERTNHLASVDGCHGLTTMSDILDSQE